MRFFLVSLFLFNFCHGEEAYTYLQENITYAGMKIKCVDGCGTYDDPDMQKIWLILERAISKTFSSVSAFKVTGEAELQCYTEQRDILQTILNQRQ